MEGRTSFALERLGSRAEAGVASSSPIPARSGVQSAAASSLIRAAGLVLACSAPLGSHAAPYFCIGKVDQVMADAGRNVNASFSFAIARWRGSRLQHQPCDDRFVRIPLRQRRDCRWQISMRPSWPCFSRERRPS